MTPTLRHGSRKLPLEYHHLACTMVDVQQSLLWYGGYDGESRFGSLHQLNTTTLNWEELYQCTPQGPMAKSGCGLALFHGNKAALFGGYGIPIGPTQPGSALTMQGHWMVRWKWVDQ